MGTKVKGIFKGLRHISHIFDEKQDEIVIGFPTDVKHVAHIGSDGPSTNQPSWMNEFKGSETSSRVDSGELLSSQGSTRTISEGNEPMIRNEISKARRKSSSSTSLPSASPKRGSDGSKQSRCSRNKDTDSATQESSDSRRGSKHSRQNRSVDSSHDSTTRDSGSTRSSSDEKKTLRLSRTDDGSTNSPTKDLSKHSSRYIHSIDASKDHSSTKDSSSSTTRRSNKTSNISEFEPTSQDLPAIPKQSRRKKSYGSSRGQSSTSKGQSGSLTYIQLDLEAKNNENIMA